MATLRITAVLLFGLLVIPASTPAPIVADRVSGSLQLSSGFVTSDQGGSPARTTSNWNVTATIVAPSEDLVDLHMIDANVGKVVSETGSIFETTDAGQSWQRLSGGLPKSDFVRISFVNQSVGWAVISKSRPSLKAPTKEHDGFIIQTQDGGRTWNGQYTIKNGALNEVHFSNENEGWAVGSRVLPDGQTVQILILHTVDQGRHWRDVSQSLGEAKLNDSAEDVFSESGSKATVLSDNGLIFVTENSGASWRRMKIPEPEHRQLAHLRIFKDPAHQLWVLASANSREVTTTRVARLYANQAWVTRGLPGWYISDITAVSGTEIFACGLTGEKLSHRSVENGEGIIAFSSDNGKSWSIIYRTKNSPSINSLAVAGPKLLAAGDNGWVFHLSKR